MPKLYPKARALNFCSWHKVAESRAAYAVPRVQLPLFGKPANGNGNVQANFRDPAFGENKNLPLHRWIPWIAGYSATFVDDVISAYLRNRTGALVLDPFCGVGTTLLQAVLRGHEAVGFEINPYPALAARAKLNSPTVDLTEFDAAYYSMRKASEKWRNGLRPEGAHPPPLKSRIPFFSPSVERQALHALAFINQIKV